MKQSHHLKASPVGNLQNLPYDGVCPELSEEVLCVAVAVGLVGVQALPYRHCLTGIALQAAYYFKMPGKRFSYFVFLGGDLRSHVTCQNLLISLFCQDLCS